MDPTSLTRPSFSTELRSILCQVARGAIAKGVEQTAAWQPVSAEYPDELNQMLSSFVTLHQSERLRGCIGALEATRPLVIDVAVNAHGAAFRDPRFNSVRQDELSSLSITISVLSNSETLNFSSEEELIQIIRPEIDGLILSEGLHRGTLLPAVWESLSDPVDFLRQLKAKAGLSPDYWSETLIIERYTTESFSD